MNGVTGPYCQRLIKELNIPKESSSNDIPKPDFGGLHPGNKISGLSSYF